MIQIRLVKLFQMRLKQISLSKQRLKLLIIINAWELFFGGKLTSTFVGIPYRKNKKSSCGYLLNKSETIINGRMGNLNRYGSCSNEKLANERSDWRTRRV